ncbi:hypothetical protein A6764_11890 [Brevibacillus sp. WF146]|uniref:hypothetical protein n=1 Tax=Brevibacillus sp. WF146 TaxID=319501 RepID=UPI0007ECDC30|nr:hypothetical protein [Brevibacillus sp. WF146]UYZ11564.1 hypothetical protein A6764_11890 [Brevibacillus sp. WF146]
MQALESPQWLHEYLPDDLPVSESRFAVNHAVHGVEQNRKEQIPKAQDLSLQRDLSNETNVHAGSPDARLYAGCGRVGYPDDLPAAAHTSAGEVIT